MTWLCTEHNSPMRDPEGVCELARKDAELGTGIWLGVNCKGHRPNCVQMNTRDSGCWCAEGFCPNCNCPLTQVLCHCDHDIYGPDCFKRGRHEVSA